MPPQRPSQYVESALSHPQRKNRGCNSTTVNSLAVSRPQQFIKNCFRRAIVHKDLSRSARLWGKLPVLGEGLANTHPRSHIRNERSVSELEVDFLQQAAPGLEAADIRDDLGDELRDGWPPRHV